jgi:hypothetical protein
MASLTEVMSDVRDSGAPLVAVETADQIAAVTAICAASNGAAKVLWDATRGVVGLNDAGKKFVAALGSAEEVKATSTNPATALEIADKLPEDGFFFMLNAHRFVSDAFVSTGILVKREPYKTTGRTLVQLGPKFDLPAELRQDVMVIDDPLPDDAQLREVAVKLTTASGLAEPADRIERAVDAIRGLSPFAAEQVLAMSLRKKGIDLDALWARKKAQIEQTKGLSLQLRGPAFADIGGNAEIVRFARRMMTGKNPPRAVFLIDEIDKYMAGSTGQQAGSVDADYLGVLLREMENRGHDGAILLSPPGCGKTLFAIALAIEFGLPLVHFDFGAMKGKWMGDSETAVREAFKTGNGIANGRAFVVATCNRLDSLAPELRRRFTSGLWYFDLPDKVERGAIWLLQQKSHGLPLVADITFDEGWTGAEIRNCCRIASRLEIPLKEAAGYVVPVTQSDPKSIESLRSLAEGRFLSANYPGTYSRTAALDEGARKVRLTTKES